MIDLPPAPRRRSAPRRWAGDLGLGVRLSVAGGRAGWARLGMIAVGVGLGVTMLLITASIPALVAARSARVAARADPVALERPVARGDTTVLVAVANTDFGERRVQGTVLQAEGAHPVLPPGVTALPGPGEMLVSPALRALLESADGAVLRDRWPARVTGEIGPAGLSGPGELFVYLGSDRLTEDTARRADRFGRPELDQGLDPTLMLLGVLGLAALLVPVGVFVATAVRFGGETRDRRLAAVRLVGPAPATTRRIAAGETLAAALLGLLAGGLLFGLAVLAAGRFVPAGMSFYTADARPVPALAVLTVVLVPVSAVLVTLSALRTVVVEPLGVVRLSAGRHRRLWWRLILPVLGLALLWPLRDGLDENDVATATQVQVLAGLIGLLVGVALLLPWWVDATVRRLGGGSVAWELAVRRLQLDSGTAVRAVSGIAVSVAGAIALQGLLVAVQAQYTHETGRSTDDFQATVWPMDLDTARWETALRGSPGVAAVSTETAVWATDPGSGAETLIQIGDCVVLRQLARLGECADGAVFIVDGAATPGVGYDLGGARWTVPATARTVPSVPGSMGAAPAAVLITPGALGGVRPEPSTVEYYVSLTAPDAIEQLRNTVVGIDPTAGVSLIQDRVFESVLIGIRQALLVLATALLLLIGASMVVNVAEQLTERRRLLAVLVAFGTRRATLTGSVLYQVAIPVLLGMVLAILTGAGVGAVLQTAAGAPISLDWSGMAITTGAAVLVILLATLASLPLLWRLTTPAALRTE